MNNPVVFLDEFLLFNERLQNSSVIHDAVLCIYDSINYLTDTRDFIRTVGEVSKVTRSGGLFIFDVCTVKNSEMFFSQNSMVENLGDIRYERICKFDSVRRIQENHFIIRKFGKRYVENHYQKIYRLDEIRAMIADNNFDEIGIYDDLSFLPGTENSERVHFVLKKRDKVIRMKDKGIRHKGKRKSDRS